MKKHFEREKIEWLETFSRNTSNDISFDIYKDFADTEENIKKYWDAFSDFYYISCPPFKEYIEKRKNVPEIYEILKRSIHMANWHPLEILIWKYSEDSIKKAKKITEEKRKEFEWTWIIIWEPKLYMNIIWFFWWSSGRNNQYIIKKIIDTFPEKIKHIKAD